MISAPKLTISAQQTRFESSALVAPTTKDIDIKDLSITIEPQKEIISRADLHLREHGHFVLLGRNGTGKSTLLYALANGLIPGISWRLKILLLGQTAEVDVSESLGGLSLSKSETVLEHVLRSDRAREVLLQESASLSAALDHTSDSTAPVKALRQVKHQRLTLELEEVKRLAERRSGARGKNARKELITMEEAHAQSALRLEEDAGQLSADAVSEGTQAAAELLADIQAQLELIDAAAAEANARKVLLGLGFSAEQIDGPVKSLSGGWRSRCDLCCALCQHSDILILDEPTNFLDLPSVIWLQNYLATLTETTVLVVTHDRDFVDAVCEDLIILRDKKFEYFHGSLSTYESEKWKKIKWMTKMKEGAERQKKHMEKTIANNISDAKKHGDDKKLKQAASRKKKVEDRTGMQVSALGHRFKLNRDMPAYNTSRRVDIEIPDFEPPVKLGFPKLLSELRFPGALVSLEGVCFSYSKQPGARQILDNINLTIYQRDRIGIAGLNGSGKSTLVALLVGVDESNKSIVPTKGTITKHPRSRIARFSQQSVEELQLLGSLNPAATALSHLMETAGSDLSEQEARGVLGALGLQGQIVSHVPIAALSGGQKVRLAFAKLVYKPPHLLVLDEVTTHLDSDTIQSLIRALKHYDGALLVVTHDRFFMRCVVEGESPTATAAEGNDGDAYESDDSSASDDDISGSRVQVVYRMRKGQLVKLDGGMMQYEEIAGRQAAKLGAVK